MQNIVEGPSQKQMAVIAFSEARGEIKAKKIKTNGNV
jgi:hypothetical protein